MSNQGGLFDYQGSRNTFDDGTQDFGIINPDPQPGTFDFLGRFSPLTTTMISFRARYCSIIADYDYAEFRRQLFIGWEDNALSNIVYTKTENNGVATSMQTGVQGHNFIPDITIE
jgi:hypothetical protein